MADKNFAVKNGLTVANNLLLAENGKVSINASITPVSSLEINSTDGIKIPVGNTGQRPSGNSLQIGGVLRYNTDLGMAEIYTGVAWANVVVGGNGTSSVTIGGSNTEIQFNDSTTLGASANLRFDKATSTFTVGNTTIKTDITGNTLTVGNHFAVNATGFLRVGSVSGSYVYIAVKDNYPNAFFYGVHSNTDGSTLRFHRTRATYVAQTVPQATDNLASFVFSGYTPGTSIKDVAAIRARATETYTNNAHGSEIIFSTSNTGANTLTDRLIISANASVTVNGTLLATTVVQSGNSTVSPTGITTGNSTVYAQLQQDGQVVMYGAAYGAIEAKGGTGAYLDLAVGANDYNMRMITNATAAGIEASSNLGITTPYATFLTNSVSLPKIDFPDTLGPKLEYYSTPYATGIQTGTLYNRTGDAFAWYINGSHSDTALDSGGGNRILTINSTAFAINAASTFANNIVIDSALTGKLFFNQTNSSHYQSYISFRKSGVDRYLIVGDSYADNTQNFSIYNPISTRTELIIDPNGRTTFANNIVTTGVNVGSNASLSTSSLFIGNSTVNATVNSTAFALNGVAIGGNTFTGISVGNSTVNTQIDTSQLRLTGTTGNVWIWHDAFLQLHNPAGYLRIGNSTINATVNSNGIYPGANVSLTRSTLIIGNSTVNATVNSTAFALNGVAIGGGTGKQSIYIPAGAMISTTANGATLFLAEMSTTNNIVNALRFDGTTRKNAQFTIAMPKSWDEGTISFKYFWTANTTSTPGVTFAVEAVAVSDTDNINVAFGTAQYVSDTFQSNNKMHVSGESSAITVSGTPAEQDMIWLKVWRDVANTNDTMTANAELIGIMVYYTTNAGNDT